MSPELSTIISFIPLFGIIFTPIATYFLSVRLARKRLLFQEEEVTKTRDEIGSDVLMAAYEQVKEDNSKLQRRIINLEVQNTQLKTENEMLKGQEIK